MDAFIKRAIKEDKKCFPNCNYPTSSKGIKAKIITVDRYVLVHGRFLSVYINQIGLDCMTIYVRKAWLGNLTKEEYIAFTVHKLKGDTSHEPDKFNSP